MSETPFKDRRKYVRIYRNLIINCRVKDTTMVHEICQLHDISRGGACFAATTQFNKGTTLVLDLKTPFLNNTIQLEAMVIASDIRIKGIIYTIHVQWIFLTESAETVLSKIEQYSDQQR